LKTLPITVIVGNPPYSAGQDSANDDNANESYPTLDAAIRATYAARSTATNKNSLYDSYIRAIKWATLRIKGRGVIAYVTNGGWLDSNTADGMRKTLAEEFSAIYVLNLRGNQRTAGEQSKREGGKVFGGGSRATVAVTILVKNPTKSGPATIHYADIGDYLRREEKLAKVARLRSVDGLEPVEHITPNEHGDWLNRRRDDFETFLPIGDKDGGPAVFALHSGGLKTNRDAWCYSFSETSLTANMRRLVETYEAERLAGRRSANATRDETLISWNRGLLADLDKGKPRRFTQTAVRQAAYRPFTKQRTYFNRALNDMVYRLESLYPKPGLANIGFVVMAPRPEATPAVLMVDSLPDLSFYSYTGQYFARWRYAQVEGHGMLDLGDEGVVVDGYRKIDNITDEALRRFTVVYGSGVTKDDIYFYVYGLLHSPEYRETYAADLKKMLPRIPLVEDPWPFVEAGRQLSDLHVRYESVTPYRLAGLDITPVGDPYEFYRVEKMSFARVRADGKLVADRSTVVYNSRVTLSDIPDEAYRYMLGARSAIEWIIDRYQVKTDAASGIINDPNDWSREVENPRYIIDLLARIVTVSLETMAIVDGLPALRILSTQR
jgi:predicted helicase